MGLGHQSRPTWTNSVRCCHARARQCAHRHSRRVPLKSSKRRVEGRNRRQNPCRVWFLLLQERRTTDSKQRNGIKRICRLIEKVQKGARIYGTSVGEWMASQAPQAMHHLRHDYSWQVELRSEFENSPSSLTNDPPLTIYELREIPARWALTSRCWCRTQRAVRA